MIRIPSNVALTDILNPAQRAVLNVLRADGPLTHEGLVDAYQTWQSRIINGNRALPPQTDSGIRTRCTELFDLGYVEHTGHVFTKRGRKASLWVAEV